MAASPGKETIHVRKRDRPSFSIIESEGYKEPIFIGLAGGTASGKTTVCDEIFKRVRVGLFKECTLIPLDCFYKECTEEQMANIGNVNFDHPDMFDWDLLK